MNRKNGKVDTTRTAAIELEADRILESGELVGVTGEELNRKIAKALPGSIYREALLRIRLMIVS